ncbi:ATP-binding protein [Cloacibacterium sp.]|uniref:sensor histidine kinase n=1 Tax=Cloacibacterium sp. TaxID=1913682 RepID=UPI0039E3EB03
MKIATKTALAYGFITAAILFIFAYGVYIASENNREEEFYDRLDYKVTWRAEFIFDANISEEMLRKLHKQNQILLNEADISVYDNKGNLYFTDERPPLGNPKILEKLKQKGRVKWASGNYQYLGIIYSFNGENYYIIGKATDLTGLLHIKKFKENIVILYLISVGIVFFIGFLFSYYTLQPLKNIIVQIKDISEQNLHKRINLPKSKDEIFELAQTFNTTFNRLEKSFNNHKNFVSTISHEFRTPLSTLIAELELAKELNTSIEDYRLSIDNALEDAEKASELSSALLDFARASYDVSQIKLVNLRIDEVLMETKLNLISKNNSYKINISYGNNLDAELSYSTIGNPYLLQVAFSNLMENACKYSADASCNIEIMIKNDKVEIQFTDHGYGIPKEDQELIFNLFYRGSNKNTSKGNGVGLAIVKQIINMHNGLINLTSTIGVGSTFSIILNRNKNL